MKKYAIAAIMMAVGVSGAFAASIGVPLFVDNAGVAVGIPASNGAGVTGVVTLKNMLATDVTCSIQYYNLAGDPLGPFGADSTFTIKAGSSLAFRPVAEDPAKGVTGPTGVVGQIGGQEGEQGVKVPDRPRDVDTGKNGSIVISWTGGPNDINGQVAYFQTSSLNGEAVTFSYSHLLAPALQ